MIFCANKSKAQLDIFMLSETKLEDSFPQVQFLIEGFHSPFRFNRKKTGGALLLYVPEDIPAKVLSHDFHTAESFFVEIILHKKEWLINCSYNPHKNSSKNHIEIISRTLDINVPLNTKTSCFRVTLIHVLMMIL